MRTPALASLCIALAALCFAGCSGRPAAGPGVSGGPTGAGTSPVAVRVGYFPNLTHAPAVLGFSSARASFAKALAGKATVETKVFNAGPAAMEALHAKALDVCFVGPTPAINAYARGGDVVLVSNVANGGSVLVARADAGIATVADLEGRKIAIPQLGNTQDAMLRLLLLDAGIKTGDRGGKTTVLAVENPDVLSLFKTGQLDAACVPEPWGARLEAEAGATVVLDADAIWRDGDYPVTVLVARKEFLESHRDVVETIVRALAAEIDYLATDPGAREAFNAELETLTRKRLPDDVLAPAMARIRFEARVNPEALRAMAELMHKVGYAKDVPDIAGLLDPDLAPHATPAAAGESAPRKGSESSP